MLVYVKFLEGPQKNKMHRVPVSKINYKFKDYNNYNKMKKYSIQCTDDKYYKAIVIFFDETIEAINARVSKRAVIPPTKDLDTASEHDSQKVDSLVKKSKSTLEQKQQQQTDDLKLKKYASVLSVKTENLKKIINEKDALKNEAGELSKSSAIMMQVPKSSRPETSTEAKSDKENLTHNKQPLEDNSDSTSQAADGVEPSSLINNDKSVLKPNPGLKIVSEVNGLSTKQSSQLIIKLQDEARKLQKNVPV